jgi:Zinc finger, C2H2 type
MQLLPETKFNIKPFAGGLAQLHIQSFAQSDVKPVLKFENDVSSPTKFQKIKTELIDELPVIEPLESIPDVKPKLKPFTGNVQSLPIRPVLELPDIKPLISSHKKFNCDLCKKGVGTKGGLLYHMKAHLNGRPFKCDICKKSYSTKNDFDTHNKRHSGQVFMCDFCNRNFSTKQYVADHIILHHLPKVFKCPLCKSDRYFSSVKLLGQHKITHKVQSARPEWKIYSCSFDCGYKTFLMHELKFHESRSRQMKFQCKFCQKKFPCRIIYYEHLKIEKNKVVECTICKRKLVRSYMKNHMNYFHRKPLVCEFCNNFESKLSGVFFSHVKQCASQEMLRSKGHQCTECCQYFYNKYYLQAHFAANHGLFTCKLCPVRYKNNSTYQKHMRKHKDNPIRCLSCPKNPIFPNMQAFNSHFRREHSYINYKRMKRLSDIFGICNHCIEEKRMMGRSFKTKILLKKHMVEKHLKGEVMDELSSAPIPPQNGRVRKPKTN